MKKNYGIVKMIIMVLLLTLITPFHVDAASSKASKAKSAYKSYLSHLFDKKDFQYLKQFNNYQNYVSFMVKDLTGDGVPEMVIRNEWTSPCGYYVYTYQNSKVKKIKTMDYYSGGELQKYYPKTKVLKAMEGDSWNADTLYYKVTTGGLKKKAYSRNNKYYVDGKAVSKQKYQSKVKELTKGTAYGFESGTYKFHVNNSSNRMKYIR